MIYLDNAATTLIKPPTVATAVNRAMKTMASPGRGAHRPAMAAANEVYDCREAAAELFNVDEPERVVFTMNATHALNIAIKSMAHKGSKVVISGFEHNSVVRPLKAVGADVTVAGRELFNPQSLLRDFERSIHEAELVVCTHVSNAFGFILPIYEVAELCRENHVPLIVDASQSAGILPVDMKKLGAAFIAMPGHKGLFGPQGTGILLCGEVGKTLMEGGSGSDSISEFMPDYLPDRLEAGTHNVCGIAGLRAGIEFVKAKGTSNILRHEKKLLQIMIANLKGADYEIFADEGENQCGVISLRSRKMDCESLAEKLYARDICVRSGLHCAPLAHKSVGTIDTGTVRFSFSPFVSPEQIRMCCRILRGIV